jgi:hypothetical protein
VTTASVSDSNIAAASGRTAVIIPFPVRPKPADCASEERAPEERLARALASLNQALAEQLVAIATWRDALGQLKGTANGLRGSLLTYQANLQTLGDSVSAVHEKATSLEAWADEVMEDRVTTGGGAGASGVASAMD